MIFDEFYGLFLRFRWIFAAAYFLLATAWGVKWVTKVTNRRGDWSARDNWSKGWVTVGESFEEQRRAISQPYYENCDEIYRRHLSRNCTRRKNKQKRRIPGCNGNVNLFNWAKKKDKSLKEKMGSKQSVTLSPDESQEVANRTGFSIAQVNKLYHRYFVELIQKIKDQI